MTLKGKLVRTVVMEGVSGATAGGAVTTALAAAVWTAQRRYRVIGAKVKGGPHTTGDTTFDASASMFWQLEVSRNPALGEDGTLVRAEGRIGSFAMGSPASGESNVNGSVKDEVMFPEGHGVDVDEGESLALHIHFNNNSADAGAVTGHAILYMVDIA